MSFALSKTWKKRLTTGLMAGAVAFSTFTSPARADSTSWTDSFQRAAIVPLFQDTSTRVASPELEAGDLVTNWGYGPAENAYNDLIVEAIEANWPDADHPIDPLLFKALIATESAFKKDAFSRTGCAGLVQIAPDTAKRFGLSTYPVDERLIPEKALAIGLLVLAEKQRVILEPDNYFGILLNRPEKKCPFGAVVFEDSKSRGLPEGADLNMLGFASYNGGGGTVMRAMAKAVEMGKNPHNWDELVGTGPADSPLYAACVMIYKGGAAGKYREMANYPKKIYALTAKTAR